MSILLKDHLDYLSEDLITEIVYQVDWKNGVQRFWDFYGIVTLLQKMKRAPQYAGLDPTLINVPYKMQPSFDDINPMLFNRLREAVEDVGEQVIYTLGSDMNTYLKRACIMEFGHIVGSSNYDEFRSGLISQHNADNLTQDTFKAVLQENMPDCPFFLALKLLKFGKYFSPAKCKNGLDIWDAYWNSVYGKEPSTFDWNVSDPRKSKPDEDPDVTPKVAPSKPDEDPDVEPSDTEAEIEPPPEQDPELHEPSWTDKWIKDKLGDLVKEHGEAYLKDVEKMLTETDILTEEFLTEERLDKGLISRINRARIKAGMSLQDIVDGFFYVPWSPAFGGPAWGIGLREGLKLWKMMNDKSDMERVMLQIDHIYDLHHNTSVMLNKGDLYVPTEILDKRARITEMAALVPMAGPQVRKLLIASAKYFYPKGDSKTSIEKFDVVKTSTDGHRVTAEQEVILQGWLFHWNSTLDKYEAALEIEAKTPPDREQLYRYIPYYFLAHSDGHYYSGDGEGGRVFRSSTFEEALKQLPPKVDMAAEVRVGVHKKESVVDKLISSHIRIQLDSTKEQLLRGIQFDWRSDSKRYKATFVSSVHHDNRSYLYAFSDGTFLYHEKVNPSGTHKIFTDFQSAFAYCQNATMGKVVKLGEPKATPPTTPATPKSFLGFPAPKPAAPPKKPVWPSHSMTTPSMYVSPTQLPPNPASNAIYTAHVGIHTPPTQTIRLTQEDEQKLAKAGFIPQPVETDVWYVHKTVGDTIKFYPNNTAKIILTKNAKNTPPVITFSIEKMLAWVQTNYTPSSTKSPIQTGAKPLTPSGAAPEPQEPTTQTGTQAGMLFHKKIVNAGFEWHAPMAKYLDGKNTLLVNPDKTSVLNISGGEVHKFNNMPELVAFLEDEYEDEKKTAKPTAEPPPEEKPSAVSPATPVAPPADTAQIVADINHVMSIHTQPDGTINPNNKVSAIIALRQVLLSKLGETSLKSNKVSLDASKWVVEHFPLFMEYVTANGIPPLDGTADQIEATITGWKAAQKPVLTKDKGKKLIKLMGQLGFKQTVPTEPPSKKGNIYVSPTAGVIVIYSDHTSTIMSGLSVLHEFTTIDQLILYLETMLGAKGATKEHHGVTEKVWKDLAPTITQHGFISTWNSGQGQEPPFIAVHRKPPLQQTTVCTIRAFGNYYQINDAQDKPVGTYYSFQDLLEALSEFLLDEANLDFGPSPEEISAESPHMLTPHEEQVVINLITSYPGLTTAKENLNVAFSATQEVLTPHIYIKFNGKTVALVRKVNGDYSIFRTNPISHIWTGQTFDELYSNLQKFLDDNFGGGKEPPDSGGNPPPEPPQQTSPTWKNVFSDEDYGKDYPVEEKDIAEIQLNEHDAKILGSIGFEWDEKEEYYIKDVGKNETQALEEDIIAGEPYYEVVTCYNTGNAIWEKTDDPSHTDSSDPDDPNVKQGPIKEILNFVWQRWGSSSKTQVPIKHSPTMYEPSDVPVQDFIGKGPTNYFKGPKELMPYVPYAPYVPAKSPSGGMASTNAEHNEIMAYGFEYSPGIGLYTKNYGNATKWEAIKIAPTYVVYFYADPDTNLRQIYVEKDIGNVLQHVDTIGNYAGSPQDHSQNLFDYKNYLNTKIDNLGENESLHLIGPDHQAALAQGFEWIPSEGGIYVHPNGDQFQVKNSGWSWYFIDGTVGDNTTKDVFEILKHKYDFQEGTALDIAKKKSEIPTANRVKAKVPTHYALTAHYGYTWIEGIKAYQRGVGKFVIFTDDGKIHYSYVQGNQASYVDFDTDETLLKYLHTKDKKTTATSGKQKLPEKVPTSTFDYVSWGQGEIEKGTYTKNDTIQLIPQDDSLLHHMGYTMKYTGASKEPKFSNVYNGPNDTHLMFKMDGSSHYWHGEWDNPQELPNQFASPKELLQWLWKKQVASSTEGPGIRIRPLLHIEEKVKEYGYKWHEGTKQFVNTEDPLDTIVFMSGGDIHAYKLGNPPKSFKDENELYHFLGWGQLKHEPTSGKKKVTGEMPYSGFDYSDIWKKQGLSQASPIRLVDEDEKTLKSLGFVFGFDANSQQMYQRGTEQLRFYADGKAKYSTGKKGPSGTLPQWDPFFTVKDAMQYVWDKHSGFIEENFSYKGFMQRWME